MKLTRSTVREWAESLAVAFVVAMVIRHFVVEAFRIPTSSMEPTLIGRQRNGDRILVNKFWYDLHKPRQWDVTVFRIDETRIDYYREYYHGAREEAPPDLTLGLNGTVTHSGGSSPKYVNYVKRLVGLPGQTIQVINGDLFIDGRIARKPAGVEEELLVPVMSADCPGTKEFLEQWLRHGAKAQPTADGGITLLGTLGDCELRYIQPVTDQSLHVVGDLKLAFRFRQTDGAGSLHCRLSDDETTYTFILPLGQPGAVPQILYDDEVAARADAPFDSEGEHLIEVSNLDARAVLKVDGRVLVLFDNDNPSQADAEQVSRLPSDRSRVSFGADGCDVAVHDVRLWRDIYYTDGRGQARPAKFAVSRPLRLGDDEYFMMGDNSPRSFDSRNWGVVKRASLVGEAFFVFWPIPRWRFIN